MKSLQEMADSMEPGHLRNAEEGDIPCERCKHFELEEESEFGEGGCPRYPVNLTFGDWTCNHAESGVQQ